MSQSYPIRSHPANGTGVYTPGAGGAASNLVGMPPPVQASSTNNLEVYDEGVLLTASASRFDFTGAGVTASAVGTAVTVNVPNNGTVTNVATGTGLTGGPITTTGTVTLADTAVTPGSYGDATNVGSFTVDQQGRLTAASNTAITFPASTITTQEEGSTLSTTVTTLNFVGQDVTASGAGATTTITKGGLTSTVTSATPVVLSAASTRIQVFTGSTAQTVTLPDVSVAPASNGYNWEFHNDSTAALTIRTSGLNTLATVPAGSWGIATIVDIAGGTGTASWDFLNGASGAPVLDSAATPTYPVSGDTKGVWHGTNTKANAFNSTCITIGPSAATFAATTIAIGSGASAKGTNAICIGNGSNCYDNSETNGITIGTNASSAGSASIVIGLNATDGDGVGVIAIGNGAFGVSGAQDCIALGKAAQARHLNAIAIGTSARVNGADANGIAIGTSAVSQGASSLTIGHSATDNDLNGVISIGPSSSVGSTAFGIGFGCPTASVNPGSLGMTVNGVTYQIPLYRTLYSSTATAAGTTTLTVASAKMQRFSGSTTQTVVLPVVTTLANGFEFVILNDSTGAVTVQSSGANTITTLAAAVGGVNRGGWGRFVCVNIAGGTGVASWSYLPGATIL